MSSVRVCFLSRQPKLLELDSTTSDSLAVRPHDIRLAYMTGLNRFATVQHTVRRPFCLNKGGLQVACRHVKELEHSVSLRALTNGRSGMVCASS